MNHTPNYQLSQWAKSDRVLMDDFNADNAKIDAALKSHGDALSLMPKFAAGTYTGDGAESRTISLPFTPKAVFVCTRDGAVVEERASNSAVYGGLALTGAPVLDIRNQPAVEIQPNGFKVYLSTLHDTWYHHILTNSENIVYHYLAIG